MAHRALFASADCTWTTPIVTRMTTTIRIRIYWMVMTIIPHRQRPSLRNKDKATAAAAAAARASSTWNPTMHGGRCQSITTSKVRVSRPSATPSSLSVANRTTPRSKKRIKMCIHSNCPTYWLPSITKTVTAMTLQTIMMYHIMSRPRRRRHQTRNHQQSLSKQHPQLKLLLQYHHPNWHAKRKNAIHAQDRPNISSNSNNEIMMQSLQRAHQHYRQNGTTRSYPNKDPIVLRVHPCHQHQQNPTPNNPKKDH
mmetsp:Transcript_24728/g.69426  ORF Transcript_24728/g.69426 Transcript_24728/m.69426 type:complete len:253 (+) Transcript_24728:1033-1791(+)